MAWKVHYYTGVRNEETRKRETKMNENVILLASNNQEVELYRLVCAILDDPGLAVADAYRVAADLCEEMGDSARAASFWYYADELARE